MSVSQGPAGRSDKLDYETPMATEACINFRDYHRSSCELIICPPHMFGMYAKGNVATQSCRCMRQVAAVPLCIAQRMRMNYVGRSYPTWTCESKCCEGKRPFLIKETLGCIPCYSVSCLARHTQSFLVDGLDSTAPSRTSCFSRISLCLHTARQGREPAIEPFAHHILDLALILPRDILRCQCRRNNVMISIHGLLQRIILPPKHIIRMCREPRLVPAGPEKRLAPVVRPLGHVIEPLCVPHCLQQDLRNTDGMGIRTFATVLKSPCLGVWDVVAVVWGV